MRSLLLKKLIFLTVLAVTLSGIQADATCTLTVDSVHNTNVTCNGLSNGSITVYTHGGQGTVNYSSGSGGTPILSQPFNSNVLVRNGSTSQYYIPGVGGCSHQSSTPYYPVFTYSSSMGCPSGGGAVFYQGDANWGYEACFFRTPAVNLNGINTVTITMDVTNNASGATDNLNFSVWVNNGYQNLPMTINGVSTKYLYFGSARSCAPITITIDLSTVPTNSRNDFLFYVNSDCEHSLDCSSYLAVVDNLIISSAAPTQTSNTFSNLAAGIYNITVTDTAGCTVTITDTITQPNVLSATVGTIAATTHGGSDGKAYAAMAGGTQPYSYHWANGGTTDTITGLTAAQYCVTITDAHNCSASNCGTVSQPACSIILTGSSDSVLCYGGSTGRLVLNATGGTSPYHYSINGGVSQLSDTFSNLSASNYSISVSDNAGCTATGSLSVPQSPQITLSLTQDSVLCNGGNTGSIIATAGGGSPSYQFARNATPFQLSGTFNNLVAGPNTIYVHDGHNCSISSAITVLQPALLSVVVNSTPVSTAGGHDGQALAVVTGGSYPLTGYAWSNSATSNPLTGLPAGVYCVTVSDHHGCVASACDTVTQPNCPGFGITDSIVNVSTSLSSDGAFYVTVTGGAGQINYNWSNGSTSAALTNLPFGYYCVAVSDSAGCQATICDSVKADALGCTLAIDSIHFTYVTPCVASANGSIVIYASGGFGRVTYSIDSGRNTSTSDSFPHLASANYNIVVKDDNQCTVWFSANPLFITQPTPNTPVIIAHGDTLSTGTFIDYAWYLNNHFTGDTTQSIVPTLPGDYKVQITDSNGCTYASAVYVDDTLGINSLAVSAIGCTIYPNPFNESLNVNIDAQLKEGVHVELFDLFGRELYDQKVIANTFTISTSGLAQGIYILKLKANEQTLYKRVMKEN